MREDVPQIAEHAFGYGLKTATTVSNPQYAILLGLRSLGWLTYEQCQIRVFGWSREQISQATPQTLQIVSQTLLEMEELGLVHLKRLGLMHYPDGRTEPWITEVQDATGRVTRRENSRINEGNNDTNC